MRRFFEKLFVRQREVDSKNERGSTMVEYVFLVALISLGCLSVITIMRFGIEDKFNELSNELGQGNGNF